MINETVFDAKLSHLYHKVWSDLEVQCQNKGEMSNLAKTLFVQTFNELKKYR